MVSFDPLHCPVTGFTVTAWKMEKLRLIQTKYHIM